MVASIPQMHSENSHNALSDIISIFHGRGALKSNGLKISALGSLHYSLPSLAAGLIYVDKGLDGRLWFSLYLLRFDYFYPTVDSAALEWHHSSISKLNHLYSTGPEVDLHLNLFPADINYTSIVHADNHWTKYGIRQTAFGEGCAFGDIFSPRHLNAIFAPQVSPAGWL